MRGRTDGGDGADDGLDTACNERNETAEEVPNCAVAREWRITMSAVNSPQRRRDDEEAGKTDAKQDAMALQTTPIALIS